MLRCLQVDGQAQAKSRRLETRSGVFCGSEIPEIPKITGLPDLILFPKMPCLGRLECGREGESRQIEDQEARQSIARERGDYIQCEGEESDNIPQCGKAQPRECGGQSGRSRPDRRSGLRRDTAPLKDASGVREHGGEGPRATAAC